MATARLASINSIARRLGVSRRTVELDLSSALDKLASGSLARLIRLNAQARTGPPSVSRNISIECRPGYVLGLASYADIEGMDTGRGRRCLPRGVNA